MRQCAIPTSTRSTHAINHIHALIHTHIHSDTLTHNLTHVAHPTHVRSCHPTPPHPTHSQTAPT